MLFFRSKQRDLFLICISLLLSIALFIVGPVQAASPSLFPEYPCIQKNIRFWESIYSKYTTNQGVLHDSDDLSRVYAIISLVDQYTPNAARINSERIDQGKAKIRDILQQLATGQPPTTIEARRIAELFPNKDSSILHAAADNIRLQLGQKDRFLEGVIRSGKYLPAFRKILATHQLPPELVYLPHVESSFNPQAYSKAGAAGLWQFTRATGRDYLTINPLIDERLDPYIATDASARLLKDNYTALQNWPLALTAYNYGRAGMIRAMNDKGSYEAIFRSYDQGSFKFAARNFYAEFLAAKRVAKSLESNPVISLERPENFRLLHLQRATPLERILVQTNMSMEQMRRLNPALQQPIIMGESAVPSGYQLRIPAGNRLALPGHKRLPISVNTQRNVEYVVQPGDTVSSIARKLRVSTKNVLAANNQRTTVQAGQKLRIPPRTPNK